MLIMNMDEMLTSQEPDAKKVPDGKKDYQSILNSKEILIIPVLNKVKNLILNNV